jgi:rhamnosyltransferase
VTIARNYDADVAVIEPGRFSHGATRNLLMERSQGEHVVFLTQDAVPANQKWLERLIAGFALADDVALTFGPYLPRDDASPMVKRELTHWFGTFSPGAAPRVDRLSSGERDIPANALLGPRGFFTDANGCVAREAWRSVPFRPVPYAEDHMLALDMLRAGHAKVYLPDAAVIHSHEYAGLGWLRRSFDESRALHEVYGYEPSASLRRMALQVYGLVGADWRWARARREASPSLLLRSLLHHARRTAGEVLGVRAGRLPDPVVRRLSLEGRGRSTAPA